MITRIVLGIAGALMVLTGMIYLAGEAWWILDNASCTDMKLCRRQMEPAFADASTTKLVIIAVTALLFVVLGTALVYQTAKTKE